MTDLETRLIKEFDDKEYAHAYMDSHLIDRISTQIYQLRLQRGWTQEQLSQESGIAQERISLLESGDFTSITMKTLRKLAGAFDVTISIKFESFLDAINDFVSLSADKLQVKPRVEALREAREFLGQTSQTPNVTFYDPVAARRSNFERACLNPVEVLNSALGDIDHDVRNLVKRRTSASPFMNKSNGLLVGAVDSKGQRGSDSDFGQLKINSFWRQPQPDRSYSK